MSEESVGSAPVTESIEHPAEVEAVPAAEPTHAPQAQAAEERAPKTVALVEAAPEAQAVEEPKRDYLAEAVAAYEADRAAMAADAIAVVSDSMLTPAGRCAAAIERAAKLEILVERFAEATRVFAAFAERAADALRRDDYQSLPRLIQSFERQAFALTQPAAPVGELERVTPTLVALGFNGLEIEIISRLVRPGEKVGHITAGSIEIGSRAWSRAEIREAGRPAYFANKPAWHAQFPPIPGAQPSATKIGQERA